jgi:hypothetical protein
MHSLVRGVNEKFVGTTANSYGDIVSELVGGEFMETIATSLHFTRYRLTLACHGMFYWGVCFEPYASPTLNTTINI